MIGSLIRWLSRLLSPTAPIIKPPPMARATIHEGPRVVGLCGKCGGVVLRYSDRAAVVSCVKGCTVVTRGELEDRP